MKYLRLPLLAIFLIGSVFLGLSYYFQRDQWILSVFANIGTSLLSTIIIIIFIDRVIYINNKKEKSKIKRTAFISIRFNLQLLLELFIEYYVGSSPNNPEKRCKSFIDMFDDEYYIQLAFLDLAAETSWIKAMDSKLNFAELSYHRIHNFNNDIQNVISKYSIYLSSEIVESFEKMLDSPFVRMVDGFSGSIEMMEKIIGKKVPMNAYSGMNTTKYVKEYIELLINTIEMYNSNLKKEDKKIEIPNPIWGMTMGKEPGFARVKMI